jgi:peroxiredoxin Q/BCP
MRGKIAMILISALIAGLVGCVAKFGSPNVSVIKPGSASPSITLRSLEGKDVPLASLQATGPLVYIQLRGWVGYQCPLCTKQVGELLAHAKDFEAAGAQVVLAYPGSDSEVDARAREFIAGKDFPDNIHSLLDPDLAAVNALGLRWDAPNETAYPAALILRDGKIAFSKISTSHAGRAGVDELLKALQ